VCREYEEFKSIINTEAQFDVDVQTSLFMNDDEPVSNVSIPAPSHRGDNLEINGRILSNGIVLRSLEEPNVTQGGTFIDFKDFEGMLPDDDDEEYTSDEETQILKEQLFKKQSQKVAKQVVRQMRKISPKEEEVSEDSEEYEESDDDGTCNVNDIL
jgi:hypothetical protein